MQLQILEILVGLVPLLALVALVVGEVIWAPFGSDRQLPNRSRMKTVTVNNEDQGFNASLVAATNDNFTFTNPHPEEFDFGEEMLLIGEMRFANERPTRMADDSANSGLLVYMSAVDRAFTATYRAALADANDEAFRAYFVKHMPVGAVSSYASGNTGIESVPRNMLTNEMRSRYRFPTWTPMPIPLNITVVSSNSTYSVNGDETDASFTAFEGFYYEYDYVIRDMTRSERTFYDGPSGWLPRMGLISS